MRAKERNETQDEYILSCLKTHEKSAEYDLQWAEARKIESVELQKRVVEETAVRGENAIIRCRSRLTMIRERLQMFREQS